MYGGLVQGQVVEERSALLASRGFASLALAYFGLEGLPKNYLDLGKKLEPVFCKKQQKESPNQKTGLGNREPLEALIDTKLILND